METIQAVTNLSPAAQTLLNFRCPIFAATTLRAAVDQVVPEENVDDADYHCLHAKWAAEGKQEVRSALLALAAELESLA